MSTSKDVTQSAKNDSELTTDTSWMDAIWKWAKDNKLNKKIIPRNSSELLALKELNLTYKGKGLGLKDIPKEIGQLTNLTSLNIRNNELTALPESIGQLVNLTSIYASDNRLEALPESISQLTKLKFLNISSNQLETLPESIGQLTKLTNLDISDNKLTTLPESIGQLTNLKKLNISCNRLETLPESIGQLINLTELPICHNQLTELPESIGQLTNLTCLDVSSNKLIALPESIGQLTNLTRLDVGNNKLIALPESIGQLTNLEDLSIYNNELTTLPESIGQLINLTELTIRHNQLTELPESIGQLTDLTRLNVSYNKLTALPKSIDQLTNLINFQTEGNKMSEKKKFSIDTNGYGVEKYAGTVEKSISKYFQDNDIDLEDYNNGEVSDIPDEFDFAPDGFWSIDDLWHVYGPWLQDTNTIRVTDDSYTEVWSSSLDIEELKEAGVSIKCISDEGTILSPFYDKERDDVNVLVGNTVEKGCLLAGELSLDEDFDPSKLTICYHETEDDGWIAARFEYNGIEAESGDADTEIKESKFYWLLED